MTLVKPLKPIKRMIYIDIVLILKTFKTIQN